MTLTHRRGIAALLSAVLSISCVAELALAVAPPLGNPIPEALSEAFEADLFSLPTRPVLGTQAAQPVWRVPVILVDFTDQPVTYSASDFDVGLFDTTRSTPTGSVFDYYRWVSRNRLTVTGRVVATVHLGQSKTFYANNSWGLSYLSTPRNAYGAVYEAIAKCDASVNWADFDLDRDGYVDMLWVLHSGLGGEATVSRDNLWSITSRMSNWSGDGAYTSNDVVPGSGGQYIRLDRFSILPEISSVRPGGRSEIGVPCHEFGHALGLPDLYDTSQGTALLNVGPGYWSLMSTGVYGGNGRSPESPTHVGAWPALFLGWSPSARPTQDTLMVLPSLGSGTPILDLWFQGAPSSEHFLIENRQREGFDQFLPAEGLVVYHADEAEIGSRLAANRVNTGPIPGLRLVEADGGNDLIAGMSRGDASDPFPGAQGVTLWDDDTRPSTRAISGAPTNVGLRDITAVGDQMRALVQVRARGWFPPTDRSAGPFAPIVAYGPGARAVLLANQSLAVVTSERRDGRPQITLRVWEGDPAWPAPLIVSTSPAAATEPTVAALPGSNLAVVWVDTRHGAGELYYRSRVGGVWSDERRLTDLPGSSGQPALGSDKFGTLQLAWLYQGPSGSEIRFLRFSDMSPSGESTPVSAAGQYPEPPALATYADGAALVVWSDRAANPPLIRFARFHPDSGLSSNWVLAQTGGTQPAIGAAVDAAGTFHAVWLSSGAGRTELHYTRRPPPGSSALMDTVIEARNEPIQNPKLACDPQGGLHLVMETTVSGVQKVLYRLHTRTRGWDVMSTEVTAGDEGLAVAPAVVARSPGVLTVFYHRFRDGVAALMERSRDAFVPGSPNGIPSGSVGPGRRFPVPIPTRAGAEVTLEWSGAAPAHPIVDVFDLSGRKIASVNLVDLRWRAGRWLGRIDADITRGMPSGVYLARPRGSRSCTRFAVVH